MRKIDTTTIKDIELTELERLCFDCPVPFGCNEKDPRCLYGWRWVLPADERINVIS